MFASFMRTITSAAVMTTFGKALATAAFIAVLSEIAKRSTWLAAAMVALPLATMLTVAFIATDPKAGAPVANAFAAKTFLLFWPGLIFFVLLLGGQRLGFAFWPAFTVSVLACFASTWGFTVLLTSLGVKVD